jgi:hypothetical protein
MPNADLIYWLLAGDIAVQMQVQRDLLHAPEQIWRPLQARIALEGWGAAYLAAMHPQGYWGRGYYQPKWTSTHYTLLELCNMGFPPQTEPVRTIAAEVFEKFKGPDGGINPGLVRQSDVCINGMALKFGAYFGAPQAGFESVVDFLLSQCMPDGGFNCQLNRKGAVHSSLHTSLSVIEGIQTYLQCGYDYRAEALQAAWQSAVAFILKHKLFQSHRTGAVIDPKMLRLTYPSRWRFDILRALDTFREGGVAYDENMQPALDVLAGKRQADGTWRQQAAHPGEVHFHMEAAGKPSRWITLHALRVMAAYAPQLAKAA